MEPATARDHPPYGTGTRLTADHRACRQNTREHCTLAHSCTHSMIPGRQVHASGEGPTSADVGSYGTAEDEASAATMLEMLRRYVAWRRAPWRWWARTSGAPRRVRERWAVAVAAVVRRWGREVVAVGLAAAIQAQGVVAGSSRTIRCLVWATLPPVATDTPPAAVGWLASGGAFLWALQACCLSGPYPYLPFRRGCLRSQKSPTIDSCR